MSSRLIPVLLLTATLCALGAGFSHPDVPAATAAQTDVAASEPVTLLETVVVRPEIEPTLLPTITVRPAADEIAAARALDAGARQASITPISARVPGSVTLPSPAFDMPYYSFGKSAYRVNKE